MEIQIEPGEYVVAVSGGVDSMVLLDLLARKVSSRQSPVASKKVVNSRPKTGDWQLIVAHFDHGMRPDSHLDRQLVETAAKKYGLRFIYKEGKLGSKTSEAKARDARYEFLKSVVKANGAKATITAHHQDDLLETAIINMLRGTGRRGLTSLSSRTELIRPLLKYQKSVIKKYAKNHKLEWREDTTNLDTGYLRNYVRHKILPKFSVAQKRELLGHIDNLKVLNADIDGLVLNLVKGQQAIDRQMFISLDHAIAREVMAGWLRSHGITDFDTKRLELLVRAAKTLAPGKKLDVDNKSKLIIFKLKLVLS